MNTRIIIRICRWMFRLLLTILAVPVALSGLTLLQSDLPSVAGALLLLAALLLPGAECLFYWLKKIESELP